MREAPLTRLLPDGRRLHLHDGPIDLILEAWGAPAAVEAAYRAAAARMNGLLDALCLELAILRAPVDVLSPMPTGLIAQRMRAAVLPYADEFITPMAAVAGAVAEAVLAAMVTAAPLDRAYVNNGGDIALHLAPGQSFTTGLIDRPDRPSLIGKALVQAADPVRGIATSGRHGRSFSLGIADAVTILAATAADADAAATIVANAVDLPDHPGILRVPADSLDPDSDLKYRLVTQDVPTLSVAEIGRALDSGLVRATGLIGRGRIVAASLHLQGVTRTIGTIAEIGQETESVRRKQHA